MSFSSQQNAVAISAVATTASVQISASDAVAPAQKCRITNTSLPAAGGVYVGVHFGAAGVTAAFPGAGVAGGVALDAVVPAGGQVICNVPAGSKWVAAIASAAGPTFVTFEFGYEAMP